MACYSNSQIQYTLDYSENFTDRSLVDKHYVDAQMKTSYIKVKQIDGLEERLERLEKVLLGNWKAQMLKHNHDASLVVENDVMSFFQIEKKNQNFEKWQTIFQTLDIAIKPSDIVKLAEHFLSPDKKIA